ncbi:uncharacterized protein EV420DRAFT_521821 [Desarmillaria tabescens]|uniref:F-box domain-containing protein n=1 Tax=Armillaria tabescens TaxID=1929756 RepID=A0AA39KA73_ARMTA|nr:uncharacterized protein EV420DRAFT_521821 [Desarmillaria tabescens]KAK0457345.1 hypothetical protein EV420DRAFT_521821 [Desarmillaria tabescens]
MTLQRRYGKSFATLIPLSIPPDVHVDLSNIRPSIVKSIPPADLDGFLRDLWQLNCRNLIPFLCLQQDWEVESVPCVGFRPPPLTSLDTVTLYLQPKHLVDWLVLSMNQSPVRRVVVCDSMSVLAQLTLPHLRTLDLQNGSISTNDLYKFLLRTSIENILISDAKLMASTENIHIQPLPRLSYIAAPPDVLTLFSPQLLAAVRSIRLQADPSSMDATQCVHNHQQAFLFISQLPNVHSLSACLGELVSTGALWADFAFPNSYERAEQRLVNITELSINDLVSIPAPQIAEAVARFPNVRNLFMLVPYSWPCLEEIATACPSLIKICTMGKRYDCMFRSRN